MKNSILLFNPRPDPYYKPVDLPISLICVSRFLDKEGYPINIIAENLYPDPYEEIRESAKDALVLGISAMTGLQIKGGLKASQIAKKANKNIKIIWGGWHPSVHPYQVLESPYIDIVIKGQGARALHDVVKRVEAGENYKDIPGVIWKENGEVFTNADRNLESIDDWPALPYHLVDIEKCVMVTEFGNRTINYVSSYGCPYRCAFCSEVTVNNRSWVGLNPEAVLDDLEKLQNNYNVNGVNLYDSLFFVNIKRAKAILRGIIKRGLTLRLGNLDGRAKQLAEADDELWELLRDSRTYSILCGAESGDQESLDVIDKDMDVEDNYKFAEKCRQYGIKVIFSTLVGIPMLNHTHQELTKKTNGQIDATIKMLDKFLSYDSRNRGQMFIYMPYPGTPLYDTAVKLGFQEPKHLDGWTQMRLYEKQTPWVTTKQAQLVSMISSYIFMFLDADTIVWAKGRIKNPIKKLLFVWAYEIFAKIAKFRWKHKMFGFPLDYQLFLLAKRNNKTI